MPTYKGTKSSCEKKLQRTFDLGYLPKVHTPYYSYEGREKFTTTRSKGINICKFSRPSEILEPSEQNDSTTFRNTPIQELADSYLQLNHDRIKGTDSFKSYLIEVSVQFEGKLPEAAGYEWVFLGKLTDGDRFYAVLNLSVRDMFRGCGLSSLIKWKEIELANENQCDFIQTYHSADNQHFLAAITPSLKRDFVLYHGEPTGGESYEEGGFIHLRKYLSRKARNDVEVRLKGGLIFKSNKENKPLLEYLNSCEGLPGKEFLTIEQYGE